MALETGTYIDDLVATNPTATDDVSEGDDHIRLIKSTVKATIPYTGLFYSTGTWTPALWDSSNSSSESQTYTTQTGTYTKIGRLVFIECEMNVLSSGSLTATDQVSIGDLPFNPAQASGIQVAYIADNTQADLGHRYTGVMDTTNNKILVYYNGDSASDRSLPISTGAVNFNEGTIKIAGCYQAT